MRDLGRKSSCQAQAETAELNEDGFRVVAIAYKEIPDLKQHYSVVDESDLTLLGYIAFLDPPKESAGAAIAAIFKFMIFIGPISSIFDYATFFTMLYVFDSWDNTSLFQTGWFVESLLTQTLIIHIIRTAKIPFLQSRASAALIATSVIICVVGIALPFTPVGQALKFTPLPPLYWPIIAVFLLTYATLTHLVKTWFVRRWGM
jgi:magnesium-transporting ATPase (P-type)